MTAGDIEHLFSYHPPRPETIPGFGALRAAGKECALAMLRWCPDGHARDNAIDSLRIAVAWANAAIATGGK